MNRNKLQRSRACLLGGNANNGSNDGFVYVNSNNELGIANQNYGSRNCLFEIYGTVGLYHLVKHQKTIGALVGQPKKNR